MSETKGMANYGRQELNPFELDGQAKEMVMLGAIRHKNHLAVKGGEEGGKWLGVEPPNFDLNISYYNETKQHTPSPRGYDTMFHIKHGYNSRLHRDDREHTVGLNVVEEERNRPVPVLSSSSYGRRIDTCRPLEDPTSLRKFVRIERVMQGFCRARGTGMPTGVDLASKEHQAH